MGARNVAQQLIESHLVSGELRPGGEIALSVDQTLTQDATGTLVMLEPLYLRMPEIWGVEVTGELPA